MGWALSCAHERGVVPRDVKPARTSPRFAAEFRRRALDISGEQRRVRAAERPGVPRERLMAA